VECCGVSSEEGNIAAESRTQRAFGAAEMTANGTLSTRAGTPVSRSPCEDICTLFNKTFINMRKNHQVRGNAQNIDTYICIATSTNCRQHEVKSMTFLYTKLTYRRKNILLVVANEQGKERFRRLTRIRHIKKVAMNIMTPK
jgi:hypothetical protein